MDLQTFIHDIQDWPNPGVIFRDISPLLSNAKAFATAIELMYPSVASTVDYWVGIESRGFLFASALAQRFNGGLVMIRKKGKLPPPTKKLNYTLEYGEDTIEMHPGSGKVVIVDDILATGGTLFAAHGLCQLAGYEVLGHTVLLDLAYLRQQKFFSINNMPVHTVMRIT